MNLEYIVKKDDNYTNINQILKNEFNISSRLFSKLINMKKISVNGVITDTRNPVKLKDKISISFDYEENNENIVPKKMNLDILYEDDWLLIINKPANVAVHPSMLHYDNSLSNAIRFYFDKIGLKKKIRPVNRLDKNTSGIVIFAKNEYIQECLINQMKNNTLKKEYLALVDGHFNDKSGIINKPIARKEKSIIERCISLDGKESITKYEVLKEFNNYSFIKCILLTGRTHQIRVHLASINHSILGDSLYGKESKLINRQALHCYTITFIHPINKTNIEIIAPIPLDIFNLIA